MGCGESRKNLFTTEAQRHREHKPIREFQLQFHRLRVPPRPLFY